MSNQQQSIGEICRNYIQEKHQADGEYWNKVTIGDRNRDFNIFCTKNADKGLDYKKHQQVFVQQLKKLSKQLEISPQTLRETSTPTKNFKVEGKSQKGNIKLERKHGEGTATTPTDATKVTKTEDGKPIVLHPPTCQCYDCKTKRGEGFDLDDETCGALPDIMFDLWHARNPNVKPLSDKEVIRVGKALKPFFAKYIGGDLLIIATPILVLGQLLSDRYGQAHEGEPKKKEKKSRDYSDEPAKDSNTNQIEEGETPRRKYFSSSKIDDIKREGEKDE